MTRTGRLVAALVLVVALAVANPAGAHARTTRPLGTQLSGTAAWLAAPRSSPPGVDPATCRPRAGRRPVILLPGTFVRVAQGFAALGPLLANRGYCVYGLNYGDTVLSTLSAGRIGAVGDVGSAARELASRIAAVRARTGAAEVDLIGWSLGGLVAREYLRRTGGGAVGRLVQLAAPNHGTTVGGLVDLLEATGLLAVLGGVETTLHLPLLELAGCAACDQQLRASPYMTDLVRAPDTVAGVDYTVLMTTHDEINTPYRTQALVGAKVRNVVLQDVCPRDRTDNLGIVYDPVALQYVLGALAGNRGAPDCAASLRTLR